MKTETIGIFFVALMAALEGQEPHALPSFPHPLVARAPDFAQWTITCESASSKSSPSNEAAAPVPNIAKRTVVTKTDDIRHIDSTDANGQEINVWCKGPIEITAGTKGGLDIISSGNGINNSGYVDYSKSDFTDLDWIAPDNYTGIKTILGKSCWGFKKTRTFGTGAVVDTNSPSHSFEVVYIAYIDKATRLPVQLKINQDTFNYVFQSPPTEMQTLPNGIKDEVSAVNKRAQALSTPPPKPF